MKPKRKKISVWCYVSNVTADLSEKRYDSNIVDSNFSSVPWATFSWSKVIFYGSPTYVYVYIYIYIYEIIVWRVIVHQLTRNVTFASMNSYHSSSNVACNTKLVCETYLKYLYPQLREALFLVHNPH